MTPWLTVDQAARHLQVSRATLYRMIADGRVKAYEIPASKRKRFKLEEIDALLQPKPALKPEDK